MKKTILIILILLLSLKAPVYSMKRKHNSDKLHKINIRELNQNDLLEKLINKLESFDISNETLIFIAIAIYILYINPPLVP